MASEVGPIYFFEKSGYNRCELSNIFSA